MTVLVVLVAAPAAEAQVIEGTVTQSSSQDLGAQQKGGSTLGSSNTVDSVQGVVADLIVGDIGQDGQQTLSTAQSGGKLQNATSSAGNQQSVRGAGGSSTMIIGNIGQGNSQVIGTTQSLKKGVANATSSASNAQLIASEIILGGRDQANDQHVSTTQAAVSGPATSTTITITGLGTIKIPGAPPVVVGNPPVVIGSNGATTTLSSETDISNSQVILG